MKAEAEVESGAESVHVVNLPVGGLNSLGSFSYNLAQPLNEFSRQFVASRMSPEGPRLVAQWDLRRLQRSQLSVAALAAFIAVAHRLRLFSLDAPEARLTWNPEVFAFLADTGVIDLLRQHDLVYLPETELAGYWHELGKTNPSTRFLILDKTDNIPFPDTGNWAAWKDEARRQLSSRLFDYTRALFRSSRGFTFSPQLAQSVVSACAELALNANYWGRSPAVVGLQRSTAGISVSVADCGDGLVRTLRDATRRSDIVPVKTHASATVSAAIYNQREYGLWRVIDEITALPNGWVSLWSFDAELHIRAPLWQSIRDLDPRGTASKLPLKVLKGRVDDAARENGYLRQWTSGIRGVRATFEISFRPKSV